MAGQGSRPVAQIVGNRIRPPSGETPKGGPPAQPGDTFHERPTAAAAAGGCRTGHTLQITEVECKALLKLDP
jgi:hypothetical protein